jgi:hypothetical protein
MDPSIQNRHSPSSSLRSADQAGLVSLAAWDLADGDLADGDPSALDLAAPAFRVLGDLHPAVRVDLAELRLVAMRLLVVARLHPIRLGGETTQLSGWKTGVTLAPVFAFRFLPGFSLLLCPLILISARQHLLLPNRCCRWWRSFGPHGNLDFTSPGGSYRLPWAVCNRP